MDFVRAEYGYAVWIWYGSGMDTGMDIRMDLVWISSGYSLDNVWIKQSQLFFDILFSSLSSKMLFLNFFHNLFQNWKLACGVPFQPEQYTKPTSTPKVVFLVTFEVYVSFSLDRINSDRFPGQK